MLNVIIGDENPDFSRSLRDLAIKSFGEKIKTVAYFKNKEALKLALEQSIYNNLVVFLDTGFDGNGIAVAKNIKEKYPLVQIIFMSDSLKCCTELYEVEHLYFLKKPIDAGKLTSALEIAWAKLDRSRENRLPIVTKEASYCIPIHEIEYLEKERRRINVFENGNKHSFYGKYEDLEKYRKGNNTFWRCHNSYVVNFKYVTALKDQCFHMRSGAIIPVSRNYSKQVREEYRKFLEKMI